MVTTFVLRCLAASILLVSIGSAKPKALRILFVGNSHTANHGIAQGVKAHLEKGGRTVEIGTESVGLLEQGERDTRLHQVIKDGAWDIVVLQGQSISMSHRYKYSQEGAIKLGNVAKASGSRTMFFAEWPRRGKAESQYIFDIYQEIAKKCDAEVIPVCFGTDAARKKNPKLNIWASDGNHSSPLGGYLSICLIRYWIDPVRPKRIPLLRMTESDAKWLDQVAYDFVKSYRKSTSQLQSE